MAKKLKTIRNIFIVLQGNYSNTNNKHGFFVWENSARRNHQQAYLAVTYEYDSTGYNFSIVNI